MENGTALEYVKAHPETDIVALVSMPTKLDEANLTHISSLWVSRMALATCTNKI